MALGNKLRFIRSILYRLKRDYGSRADLYHQSSETIDLTTGKKSVVIDKLSVLRVILLPKTIKSDFAYDLSFIAANKNFTYGGVFSADTRQIIIDCRDIGSFTFDDRQNIYIIIDGRRFEISEVTELDYRAAYHLRIKETKGAQLSQVIEQQIIESVTIDGQGDGTL